MLACPDTSQAGPVVCHGTGTLPLVLSERNGHQQQTIRTGRCVRDSAARTPSSDGASRCRIDRHVHHVAPVVLHVLTEGDARFYLSDLVFQFPVSAKDGMTSVVITGGHIGTGQRAERIDQHSSVITGCQITTVKQQVGIGRQRVSPPRNLSHVAGKVVLSQPR